MNCKNCAVIACDGYGQDHEPERCEFYTRMSNADRIRAMSDEEMATWLNTMQSNAWHSGRLQKTPNKYPSTNQTWLDWLRQEVSANGD